MNQNRLLINLTLSLLLVSLVSLAVLYSLAVTVPKPGKSAEASRPVFRWTLSSSYVLDVKLEADLSGLPPTVQPADALRRSLQVFALRALQALRAVKPKVQSDGERFIFIHAPGIKDPDLAVRLLTQSGDMELKLVDESHLPAEFMDMKGNLLPGKLPPELELLSSTNGERILLERRSLLPKNCVEYAVPMKSRVGRPAVGFKLNPMGTSAFRNVTARYPGRKLAVVFNGVIYTVAKVTTPISNGQVVIEGDFSREDAEELAQSLQVGSLPFPVKVAEKRVLRVSPLDSFMALLGIHSRSLLAHLCLGLAGLSLLGVGWISAYPVLRKGQ